MISLLYLIFVISNLSYIFCQSEYDSGIWRENFGYLTKTLNSVRSQTYTIYFTTNFTSVPQVTLGILSMNMDHAKPGIQLQVSSVTTTYFSFNMIGPKDCNVLSLDMSWFAFNDPMLRTAQVYFVRPTDSLFDTSMTDSDSFLGRIDFPTPLLSNANITAYISAFKFDSNEKLVNIQILNIYTNGSAVYRISQGSNSNIRMIAVTFVSYTKGGNIISYQMKAPYDAISSGTKSTTLNLQFYSNAVPVVFIGLSNFYFDNNNKDLRLEFLNMTIYPPTVGYQWNLVVPVRSWGDTLLHDFKYSVLVIVNSTAFNATCSDPPALLNVSVPARVCSPCNQILNPCPNPLLLVQSNYSNTTLTPVDNCNGTYNYWDASCSGLCPFPLVSYNDTSTSILYCQYPCADDFGEILSWNGSCLYACDPPLILTVIIDKPYCQFPCDWNNSQMYRFDGVCVDNCTGPYIQNWDYCDFVCNISNNETYRFDGNCTTQCLPPLLLNGYFCDFPCNLTNNESLRFDGVCVTNCSSPYLLNGFYCDFPCNLTLNETYRFDGICVQSCNLPFIKNGNYCEFACNLTLNQSYRYDGLCVNNCSSPLILQNMINGSYCNFPCNITAQELYRFDGICVKTCNLPFVKNGNYCDFACNLTLNQSYRFDGLCVNNCSSPFLLQTFTNGSYCNFPCNLTANELYLYYGGCTKNCLAPLIKSGNYCNFPCNLLNSEMYRFDGKCVTNCTYPLVQNGTYCNFPCDLKLKQMYQYDSTCVGACLPPLVKVPLGTGFLCNNPTPTWTVTQTSVSGVLQLTFSQKMNITLAELYQILNLDFYAIPKSSYTYNISQLSDVAFAIIISPLVSISRQKLTVTLNSSTWNFYDQQMDPGSNVLSVAPMYSPGFIATVKALKQGGSVAMQSMGAVTIPLLILTSNPLFLYALINLIQIYYYLLFINCEYPYNVQSLLSLFSIGSFQFLPNIFQSTNLVDLKAASLGAPRKFIDQKFDALFLLTGGGNFSMVLGLFLLGGIGWFLGTYLRNLSPWLMSFTSICRTKFTSIFLIVYNGLFINLNLAAFLQLSDMISDTKLHIFSNIFAFLIVVISIVAIILYYFEAKRYLRVTPRKLLLGTSSEFKDWSYAAQMFNVIDLTQRFFFSMFLVFLYYRPFTLVLLLAILKLLYISYLIKFRPFKNPNSNVLNGVSESLYTCAIFVVGYILLLNEDMNVTEDTKTQAGYMIVLLGVTSFAITFLVMTISSCIKCKEIKIANLRKVFRRKKKPQKELYRLGSYKKKTSV